MEGETGEQALDIPQEADFLAFYRKLPEKAATTARIFDRKDFFTLHGSDAHLVANEIIKTQTIIKFLDSDIPSLALGINKLEMILKELLIVRCFRVEIYRKPKNQKHSNWELDIKASPGNLGPLEDVLYSNEHTIGLTSLKIIGNDVPSIGFCHINTIERIINNIQFEDNTYLSSFESFLVQSAPKEVIIPKSFRSSPFYDRFSEIMSLNKCLVTEVKNQSFNEDHTVLDRILKQLLLTSTTASSSLEKQKLASAALYAAIDYLGLQNLEGATQKYKFQPLDATFVRLDSSAIKALDLFPTSSNMLLNKSKSSLYQLLNHCRSMAGQRLLAQWIRQPLTNLNHLHERQELVEFFRTENEIRQDLNSIHLRRAPDLLRLSKKFDQQKAALFDCCKLYEFVVCLPDIRQSLASADNQTIKETFVDQLAQLEEDFTGFVDLIKKTVDFNRLNDDREPMIKPEFDEELLELSKKLDEIQRKADKLCNSVCNKYGIENKCLKLEANSQTGYGFRATKKEEKTLRGAKGIRPLDRTKKDGLRFTTDELENLSIHYIDVMQAYEVQQKELVDNILKVAATYSGAMRNLGDLIARLDVLVSFAMFARDGKQYVKPNMLPKGSGKIIMTNVRHPCLEAQADTFYVPNDVMLDSSEHKFYLVTGPNMGGKSTYIRSVAISVLLAQIGSYIPADSATISIVDGIHTRVGSSDYQIKGVSTFMAEMIETSSILRSATEDSLVIIDELGRGTSTYDGFGLSWQLSQHIAANLKSYCFFATHFHELTELSKENPSIGNLHVRAETSSDNICFLYKVEKGVCDQSFGIHVAKLANFPNSIVEAASKKVKELEGLSGIDQNTLDLRSYVVNFVKDMDINSMSDEDLQTSVSQMKKYIKQKWLVNNP